MTVRAAFDFVRALPLIERRQFVETILDELEEQGLLDDAVSESEREMLEHRLARYRENPSAVTSVEDVMAELEATV